MIILGNRTRELLATGLESMDRNKNFLVALCGIIQLFIVCLVGLFVFQVLLMSFLTLLKLRVSVHRIWCHIN